MKRKVTSTVSILGIALALGFLAFALPLNAAEHEHEHAEHEHGAADKGGDKVRCAVDGMMMKASAMTSIKHDGKTVYFCNEKQAKMFKANPDKYLKTIPLGHLTLNLSLMLMDEHKEMMNDMGMGGMMKMDMMKGKTHRIGVYLTQHGREIELENSSFALQIADAAGAETVIPLAYNKMMKTYDAFVAMPTGKPQISVLITTPKVTVSN